MQRANLILKDPDFKGYIENNKRAEASRVYCGHDLVHALNVSRIAYILDLEQMLGLDKETIYAAGLLHDIGRWMEYKDGTDHAEASARLAGPILQKCGFSRQEVMAVTGAIKSHRISGVKPALAVLLYRADKLSRNCIGCHAIKTCKRFAQRQEPVIEYWTISMK